MARETIMSEEIWRDITSFEGYYQVSNLGRVQSLERIIQRRDGTSQIVRSRILKPFETGIPPYYLGVHLRKDGVRTTFKIHRLVAEAFLPNPNGFEVVDHIDCNTHNNAATNLRWCTYKDNYWFCRNAGRNRERHYRDWSSESQQSYRAKRCKPFVRNDGKRYECLADAANELGVRSTSVHRAIGAFRNDGTPRTCKGYWFTYI